MTILLCNLIDIILILHRIHQLKLRCDPYSENSSLKNQVLANHIVLHRYSTDLSDSLLYAPIPSTTKRKRKRTVQQQAGNRFLSTIVGVPSLESS